MKTIPILLRINGFLLLVDGGGRESKLCSVDRTVMLRECRHDNVEADRGALGSALQQPSALGEYGTISDHVHLV